MTSPLWRTAAVDDMTASSVASQYGIPVRVAKWICARDVPTGAVMDWFAGEHVEFTEPNVFTDMDAAVGRLLHAIETGQMVAIAGDYDVDGVTASAIMASTIDALGGNWHCLIPHRVDDGYGLSTTLVDRAAAVGAKLLITVDNGIQTHDAVSYAVSKDIDVIVTDHHEPAGRAPAEALAVLHWLRAADTSVQGLSGAGVAWKYACAVLDAAGDYDWRALRTWHTGLAALGALADVMPMTGENRRLVLQGLAALRASEHPGWNALCQTAGVDRATLTDTGLLWNITPRVNAAGRMGSAGVAFDLLMTQDANEAISHAKQLEAWNETRKQETAAVFEAACIQQQALDAYSASPMVVVSGHWNLGIAGIVAAKLVTQFKRPAIVLCDDGQGLLKGSGRATDGFPLHQVVGQCEAVLHHFGGHEAAIGCAVEKSQLGKFRQMLIEACRTVQPTRSDEVVADDYLPLSEATVDLANWAERFAPYGPDNPALSFYVGPIEVVQSVPLAGGKHFRLKVKEGKTEAELIWFQAPPHVNNWGARAKIGAVVALEKNIWKGKTKVQLRVLEAWLLHNPLVREEFGYLYRVLAARRKVAQSELGGAVRHRSPAEAKIVFDTFVELGFARERESAYHVVEQVVPRDLRESLSYQSHLRKVMTDSIEE